MSSLKKHKEKNNKQVRNLSNEQVDRSNKKRLENSTPPIL